MGNIVIITDSISDSLNVDLKKFAYIADYYYHYYNQPLIFNEKFSNLLNFLISM
jgi:hypothetical protein